MTKPKTKRPDRIPGKKRGEFASPKDQSSNIGQYTSKKLDLLPDFARNRTMEGHTTYDSDKFCYIHGLVVYDTNAGYLADAMEAAIERGHQKGNMKDKVTAQGDGFNALCEAWIKVLLTLMPMNQFKTLFENPPESESATSFGAGTTGVTNIANYSFLTWNSILAQLEGKIIPSMVMEVINELNFVIKFHPGYKLGSVDIPPMYMMPFMPYTAKTTIDGFVGTIYENQGLAQRHMDKFGVKYVKFSRDSLNNTRILSPDSKDAIAFFSQSSVGVRDVDSDDTHRVTGDFSAAGHGDRLFYFIDDPNESALNYILPILLSAYHATGNKYGGTMIHIFSTTQNHFSGLIGSQVENTELLCPVVNDISHALLRFQAPYDSTNTFNITVTGTEITEADLTINPFFRALGVMSGSGLTVSEFTNMFINYLIKVGM